MSVYWEKDKIMQNEASFGSYLKMLADSFFCETQKLFCNFFVRTKVSGCCGIYLRPVGPDLAKFCHFGKN